jgi:large subunit ribosomal protein L33
MAGTVGSGSGRRNTERVQIVLSCTECGSRNYKTTRARREGIQPLSLKKFCRICNRHTIHIESK